jgi:hypothetical protein
MPFMLLFVETCMRALLLSVSTASISRYDLTYDLLFVDAFLFFGFHLQVDW